MERRLGLWPPFPPPAGIGGEGELFFGWVLRVE